MIQNRQYLIICAVLIALLNSSCEELPLETAKVVGISDGDSIKVVLNSKEERIRLAFIDAPEFKQAFGRNSKKNLSNLIYKKNVQIVRKDVDKYGRIVAEVFIGDTNINTEQIKRGLAWQYKFHSDDQSLREKIEYAEAEEFARSKEIGLWSDENPIPPWKFRKKNKR